MQGSLCPFTAVVPSCSHENLGLTEKVGVPTLLPKEAAPAISAGPLRLRATLVALASLAALAIPETSGAAQLDPEDVEEFQSFCLDYYSPAQCAGAIRFIARTSGSKYFEELDLNEAPEAFLDQLTRAVKGGETLLAKEAIAAKAGK
jgi:hypothetical protein